MAKGRRKDKCKWVPDVPGTKEASRMYMDLSSISPSRSLTNLLYAEYLMPGVAEAMDNAGYRRNKQNQHSAKDVYTFLDGKGRTSLLDVHTQMKTFGFMDNNGNLKEFEGEEAYIKAQDFNLTNKARVAYVVPSGEKFNILLIDKDSRTQSKETEVNKALVEWNKLKEELNSRGIDINDLIAVNPSLVNPGNIKDFINNLWVLQNTPNDGLSVKDISLLLTINKDDAKVKNLLSRGWGDINDSAQKMYDIIHGAQAAPSTVSFVNSLLYNIKKLNFDKRDLSKAISEADAQFKENDSSMLLTQKLNELNKKYKLDRDVFLRESKEIKTLSDAFADAIMSVERQIRAVEIKYGKNSQTEKLRNLKTKLFKDLQEKKNINSLLEFVNEAFNYLSKTDSILNSVSPGGTNLEYAMRIADAVTQVTKLSDAYYNIVYALSLLDTKIDDFGISQSEKNQLKDISTSVRDLFNRQREKVKELRKNALVLIGEQFLGDSVPIYGVDLANIVTMAEADGSLFDYLYGVGRSTNTVASVLGAIIRDKQLERDRKMSKISLEIRRANHILAKDGKDSSFMYDDKGRIVSPYDWDTYFKERAKYSGKLTMSDIRKGTIEYDAEMELWEDQNTVPVVVDPETGRTERMPIYKLGYDFREGWSAAQNEYYDRMMTIKGKLGTMLPYYAQHQYIAPQKRNKIDEIVKEAIQRKRPFRHIVERVYENMKLLKIKEGDPRFMKNGIFIDNQEMIASTSNYDNTILRQIPVFYVNKLEEKNLSHDFSSAIQALASTALNYEAMNEIKNVAEMIADYVSENPTIDTDEKGRPKVDYTSENQKTVAVVLKKVKDMYNLSTLLDSFVLKHIYGIENRNESGWATLCMNLIGYTSFKGLAANVKGALTNKGVGILQSIIMASRGQYYNYKELSKAFAILLGEQGAATEGAIAGGIIGGPVGAAIGLGVGAAIGSKGMYGKLIDILTNDRNSKDTLIAEFFDTSQDSYSDLSDTRYHSTIFGKIYGSTNPMTMYQRGEYFIHMLNTYAILLHEKVVQYDPNTGKRRRISLLNALEKGEKIEGNPELKIKDNIFKLDGSKIESLDDEYFNAVKRRMRYVNQECNGAMNKEDKGIVHQWVLGKLTMNFRQWMVEHFSRRFRGLHWDESIRDVNLTNFYTKTKVYDQERKRRINLIDALEIIDNPDGSFSYKIKDNISTLEGITLTDDILNSMLEKYANDSGWRRGFKADAFHILKDYIKDMRTLGISANMYWDQLSETQKADVKEVLGEASMLLALIGLSACMGEPDEHKGDFYFRLWMYVVKRCLFDQIATTLPGAVMEATTLVNKPWASVQTMSGLLYPIVGLGDWGKTIQSGRYAGWNKYARNLVKYTIPFYSQIDQLLHIDTESGIFNVFEFSNQITR